MQLADERERAFAAALAEARARGVTEADAQSTAISAANEAAEAADFARINDNLQGDAQARYAAAQCPRRCAATALFSSSILMAGSLLATALLCGPSIALCKRWAMLLQALRAFRQSGCTQRVLPPCRRCSNATSHCSIARRYARWCTRRSKMLHLFRSIAHFPITSIARRHTALVRAVEEDVAPLVSHCAFCHIRECAQVCGASARGGGRRHTHFVTMQIL